MSDSTIGRPNWHDGIQISEEDFGYRIRYYSYMTGSGPVVGLTGSLIFTLDAPSSVAWEYLKDFNSFEGPFGICFSGVWGDLYDSEEHDLGEAHAPISGQQRRLVCPAQVLRVIPEHLLTLFEPIPEDGSNGGVSPGFQTVMLTSHHDKTTVTAIFEHAERLPSGTTEEQALERSKWGPKQFDGVEPTARWKNDFVPLIRRLVARRLEEV